MGSPEGGGGRESSAATWHSHRGNHFSELTVGGRGRINEEEEEPPGTWWRPAHCTLHAPMMMCKCASICHAGLRKGQPWVTPADSKSQNLRCWAGVSPQQKNADTRLRAITFLHYNNTCASFVRPGPAGASSNGRKWMLMYTARMLGDSRRCKLWMHRLGSPAGDEEVLFTGLE